MARILWLEPVVQLFRELPPRQQTLILAKVKALRRFPRMYPVIGKGRFRRHRRFVAGAWIVYYRVVEDIVYVRGLWPARIP